MRIDTAIIQRILEEEGVSVWLEEDIEPIGLTTTSLIEVMDKMDAVVAVLGDQPNNSSVLYQIGLADAMEKPVLVVVIGSLESLRDLPQHPYLRAHSDDLDSLRFGLTHFLRALGHRSSRKRDDNSLTKPIGKLADGLLSQVRSNRLIDRRELIGICGLAIREAGVDAQATAVNQSVGENNAADIAVWCDELESLIGNPLPIKIFASIDTAADAENAAKRLLQGTKARWGLMLFLNATTEAIDALNKYPALVSSVEDFVEGLRQRSFGELITQLRSQTVHGVHVDA